MKARGRFITLEGIDGAGKSSHVDFVAERARAGGHAVVVTREPGGTPLGEKIRKLVLEEEMDVRTMAMLMFAARSEHLITVIEPALRSGAWVVCDRFTDSTYAYQCGGQGLAPETFAALQESLMPCIEPDATFLFDIDPVLASQRRETRRQAADNFEREALDFAVRVREAYLHRARQAPGRIRVIDASGTLEEVRARIAGLFAGVIA
jgi:dTMP kinase